MIYKKSVVTNYKYFPETKEELKKLLNQLIKERSNEGDFNDIDTSKITDISELFQYMEYFNGDISKWDVSNVTSMESMLRLCKSFDQPLNDWDVSNVTNMDNMFYGSESFNKPLDKWNVSKVKSKDFMFYKCPIEEKYKPNFK